MSKGRMEAFSDGVLAVIITVMVLEMNPPRGIRLVDLRPVLPELSLDRYLLEQPPSPFACDAEGHRWNPLGKSAFVVLAIADAVRHCLDAGELFCPRARRVVWRAIAVRWDCLLPAHKDPDCAPQV